MTETVPEIYHQNSAGEVFTPERCYITELMNLEALPKISLARCRVTPGITTQLHCLSVAERYIIEQGKGLMEVSGGTAFEVSEGDIVIIPANESQRIENIGSTDLIFLCLCAPRFTPEAYRALE